MFGATEQKIGDILSSLPEELPVLPLRNMVAFPFTMLPIAVGVPRSVKLVQEAMQGNRLVVLVVEDEVLIRTNATDMIVDAGFEAIAASDADEAIRILESRNDIRAVFTDVQMPGSMDGMRLASVVRNRWPPVALIVTSGKTDGLERDLPTGGKLLPKPYDRAQVEAALRQLIR